MSFYVTYPSTSVSSGPIQFYKDGTPVYVSEDTSTPANSVPLPVAILNPSGIPIGLNNDYGPSSEALRTASQIGNASGQADFGSGNVSAQTLRAALASDQLSTLATESTLSALEEKVPDQGQAIMAASLPVVIASDQSDVPISATSLPLPTGAATEATLLDVKTDTDDISTAVQSIDTKTPALVSGSVPVHVDNFPGTQPISGVVAIDQTTPGTTNGVVINSGTAQVTQGTDPWIVDGSGFTQPISAASLPLPTGAATEATLLDVKTDIEALSDQLPASLGQTTKSASLSVTLSSDEDPIPTKAPINSAGSYDEITNLTTTAQTFTAPANAVGFVIEALSDNAANIRYKIGASATTTSGMRLEPGRSENYNSGPAANISVIAEIGSNLVVSVQWILSQ